MIGAFVPGYECNSPVAPGDFDRLYMDTALYGDTAFYRDTALHGDTALYGEPIAPADFRVVEDRVISTDILPYTVLSIWYLWDI